IRTGAGDIVVGQPRGGNQARIIRRETSHADDGVRVIVANEGYPALIQPGQSIPLTATTTSSCGLAMQQTEHHDVLPALCGPERLNGDTATIHLSSNHDRQSTAGRGVVDVQRTDTVVSARLGEWVTIGGVDDLESSQRRDVGRRITTRNTAQQSIRLMVERLD